MIKVFNKDDVPFEDVADGIKKKCLAQGEKITFNMYVNEKDSHIPAHSHPQELVAIVLQGEVEATFNGDKYLLRAGMGYHIPANEEHGPFLTVSEEPAIYLDILSPPRVTEEYADKK
ncbi:MAG TPA: cupin domain-containing protein [Clostridia bacterium]|nr:cupin domain-containing protein [Clostridia bacterium]